jgi:hypothetical protein
MLYVKQAIVVHIYCFLCSIYFVFSIDEKSDRFILSSIFKRYNLIIWTREITCDCVFILINRYLF